MKNEVQIKEFLGVEVRVVNDEYIVLKDMFGALGRLSKDGQIESKDVSKLKRIIGKENITKLKIYSKSNNNRSRTHQYCLCANIDELKQHDIVGIFKKGKDYIYTSYRDELSFINNVKKFFKYNKYIYINNQFQIMEYKVDLVLGCCVFIEFDEKYHKNIKEEDIERMQKISLANTYDGKHLYNTNNYKEQNFEYEEYEYFSLYRFNGALFVRVTNSYCLNWIPIVYAEYDDCIDLLNKEPKPYQGLSSDLINLKFVC